MEADRNNSVKMLKEEAQKLEETAQQKIKVGEKSQNVFCPDK